MDNRRHPIYPYFLFNQLINMTTQEVANQYVAYMQQGKFAEALDDLFADNAVSIEPEGAPVHRAEGMEAIKQKAAWWADMVEEAHGGGCSEPMVAGNHFTVTVWNDSTMKGRGRHRMDEVCVYEVQDGKIVKEQFFYPM
jgi:hypothetical protein